MALLNEETSPEDTLGLLSEKYMGMAERTDVCTDSPKSMLIGLTVSKCTTERCEKPSALVPMESSIRLRMLDRIGVEGSLKIICKSRSLQKLKRPITGGISTTPGTKRNVGSTVSSIKLRPT
ncbi:hypothetical protein BaOVIS_032830 [Babesia ovis]|uniref:Uncharacterized protein n=1 Tax=Babesia ovis TaxID=5869 RepID=A0A9W5TCQ7_BABOV|nr:hypothetical protein BaOVIS_032830 [Babesia ovis]